MGFGDFLSGSNKDAMKEQMRANERTQQYIRDQAALARGDAGSLFPAGDYARNTGINSAMSLMGQSMPYQMGSFQDGNVAAQGMMLAGMPQFQNAILGMPVDNSALQSYRGAMPDSSLYNQQLPNFGSYSSSTPPPAGSMQWQQPQQQAPQQQQMDPMQAMQTYNQMAPMWGGQPLWGGGAAASGSAPIAAGAGQASATGLSSAPMASGAAGSGGGSALAAAGPWAALAAAIVANESYQNKSGNRPNDAKSYAGELATGKVLERDAERYLGKYGKMAAEQITPHGQFNTLQNVGKWLGGLF